MGFIMNLVQLSPGQGLGLQGSGFLAARFYSEPPNPIYLKSTFTLTPHERINRAQHAQGRVDMEYFALAGQNGRQKERQRSQKKESNWVEPGWQRSILQATTVRRCIILK